MPDLETLQKKAPAKIAKDAAQRAALRQNRLRKLTDHLAAWVIKSGGLFVILCITGLLALFAFEIAPFWRDARVEVRNTFSLTDLTGAAAGNVIDIGCEEHQQVGYAVSAGGKIQFIDLPAGKPLNRFDLPLEKGEKLVSVAHASANDIFGYGTSLGRLLLVHFNFQQTYRDGRRVFAPIVEHLETLSIDTTGSALPVVALAGDLEEGLTVAAISADGRLLFFAREVESTLFGPGESTDYRLEISPLPAKPVTLALEGSRTTLFAGLQNGQILKYDLEDPEAPVLLETHAASGESIALLGFLIGDRSLVVSDATGRLSVWFSSFDESGKGPRRHRKAHVLQPLAQRITAFSASRRNRTFLTGSTDGELRMYFSTNERLLYREKLSSTSLAHISMAPKGNGALVADARGKLYHLSIDNPHPEASWKAFFGKIWYEGYPKPEYVWQSTGGSDDFEAKLSLIPLLFGTLKGTFYALIFALPVAVLAAIYVSQFMRVNWRGKIKPVMEIMAAMPSVIIGFVGGLWLAPRVQLIIPGLLAMFIVIPLATVLFAWFWKNSRSALIRRAGYEAEFLFLIPLILGLGAACLAMNGALESAFFAGNFQQWLVDHLHLRYDQRNAFIVGAVMGFAVIPIIFTISEDVLSNVPVSLKASSLALGATNWQTAIKVVLPTASPGIFSAIMIGLGRAVGETMIVLMATGNTPLMDWNIFNGFRTLSANIAVEIPEAPAGGTLFRTLFLSALLLFLMTFIVNTAAEIIRQRMRKKFETQ